MKYCVYDVTGRVLRSGSVSDEQAAALQAGVDEFVLIIDDGIAVTDTDHYVLNNTLVNYTADEMAAKRAMPRGFVWKMPERIITDARGLDSIKAAAIAKSYSDVDAIVQDAVGNRTEEYKDAEVAAQAYKDGGYVGTVPADVQCYATHNPTNVVQTGQWAADDILAKAAGYAQAKLAMRLQRMASQSDMRAAATNADVDSATAAWNTFVANTRTSLGI